MMKGIFLMGRSKKSRQCPRCASKDVILQDTYVDGVTLYVCADCDYEYEVGGYSSRSRSRDYDHGDYFNPELMDDN
jgi:transposase-like protein